MAAAYLFHIARNHPFVDGNKRTGLMAALVFLGLNDLELAVDPAVLYELVTDVASGAVAKAQIAVFFQQHSRRRHSASE
jgi:death-on-curing protein